MRKVDLRLVLVFVAGVLLFAWFLSGLHWGEVLESLRRVGPAWLLLACGFMLADYFIRAVRWRVLVRHVDPDATLSELWRATAVGNGMNTFLPLRGGDLVRPAMLMRGRRIPYTTLLSTTVVERLLDAVGFVIALVVVAMLLPPRVVGDDATLAQLRSWGYGAASTAGIGLGLVWFLATRRARTTLMYLLRPWPRPVRMRVMRTFLQLTHGLGAAGSPIRLLGATFFTGLLWACTTAAMWAAFRSLGLEVQPVMALFVAVALSGAMAVPQAPAYLGLFQVVLESVARLWGVSEGVAEAAAFVLWIVYIGPITLVALFYILRDRRRGLGLRELLGGDAPPAPAQPTPAR